MQKPTSSHSNPILLTVRSCFRKLPTFFIYLAIFKPCRTIYTQNKCTLTFYHYYQEQMSSDSLFIDYHYLQTPSVRITRVVPSPMLLRKSPITGKCFSFRIPFTHVVCSYKEIHSFLIKDITKSSVHLFSQYKGIRYYKSMLHSYHIGM